MTNKINVNFTIEEMFKEGVHYGHKKINTNTKMKPYIYETRWGISIINLYTTIELFKKALAVLDETVRKNGQILFVGTKGSIKSLLKQSAIDAGELYVNNRWLGGAITNNTSTINMLVSQLDKIESDTESGYLANFSKKEQLKTAKKKAKLLNMIEGVRKLKGIPSLLIIVDAQKEKNAILEAKKCGIPVIALSDTDTSIPELITHIVPGNDEGYNSVQFFLKACVDVILEAKKYNLEVKENAKANAENAKNLGEKNVS